MASAVARTSSARWRQASASKDATISLDLPAHIPAPHPRNARSSVRFRTEPIAPARCRMKKGASRGEQGALGHEAPPRGVSWTIGTSGAARPRSRAATLLKRSGTLFPSKVGVAGPAPRPSVRTSRSRLTVPSRRKVTPSCSIGARRRYSFTPDLSTTGQSPCATVKALAAPRAIST
jgi:hypothetical protein